MLYARKFLWLRVVCEDIPEQQDLIIKAAQALQKATGTTNGADISVVKNIPTGGGLGGGSSSLCGLINSEKGHIFPIVSVIVNALCEKISLVESCLLIETCTQYIMGHKTLKATTSRNWLSTGR
jgi:homoserine kinase